MRSYSVLQLLRTYDSSTRILVFNWRQRRWIAFVWCRRLRQVALRFAWVRRWPPFGHTSCVVSFAGSTCLGTTWSIFWLFKCAMAAAYIMALVLIIDQMIACFQFSNTDTILIEFYFLWVLFLGQRSFAVHSDRFFGSMDIILMCRRRSCTSRCATSDRRLL